MATKIQPNQRQIVLKALGLILIVISLEIIVGVSGFKYYFGMNDLDALHSTTLYMGGLGVVVTPETRPQVAFSAFYALFAPVLFLGISVYFVNQILNQTFYF